MDKHLDGLSIQTQALLQDLAHVYRQAPEVKFLSICRRRPRTALLDYSTQGHICDFIWVCGYAKSALALVQQGILVTEGYTCYSLTEHGKRVCETIVPDKPLTPKQERRLRWQVKWHSAGLAEWVRDVYIGSYSHDVEALVDAGYFERRPWEIPNSDETFGFEYRPTAAGIAYAEVRAHLPLDDAGFYQYGAQNE